MAETSAGGGGAGDPKIRSSTQAPRNTGDVVRAYKRVLIPEINLGQLSLLVRGRFLVDAVGYNKVRGKPFRIAEIEAEAERLLADVRGASR